ncbi:unnamed protein product [Brassica rapa subsp. trilocularis]
MAAKEEDGNVNADGNLAEAGEMDELLQEISDVLRSQVDIASLPPVHEDESPLGEKKETTDTSASCSQGVDRSIQNISSDQETSNEQGTSTNQLFAVSSTTSNVPVTSVEATFQPSSSDITNVETKSVPVNSGEYEMFCRFGAPTMDDALKRRYNLVINESVTKAPVENDRPLPDDEDVTNSIDYTSSEYDETRDRLKMPLSLLPIENVDDSKELSKIDPSSSDHLEAEHVQSGTHESVNQPMPTRQSITTTASSPSRSLSVPMTKALITSTDFVPKRNQQAMNLPQTQRNLPQTQRNQQAMNLPQTQRPPSGQYGNITRPPYLPPSAVLPLQQHGGSTSNMAHYVTMVTSPYWRPEQNAIYNMPPQSAAAFQQHGGSNMAHYGNITNSPYWRPEQNGIYNMPPQSAAAFQQHGRSNMMTFPYWRPEQHGSYNIPQYSAASMVPSAYGSANTFGTWSDNNPANSRFGYEGGVSSNYLPSIQPHQSGDFNAWRPSSSHSPQEQQIWNDVYASMDQQNDRSDPTDETQQRSRPRDN